MKSTPLPPAPAGYLIQPFSLKCFSIFERVSSHPPWWDPPPSPVPGPIALPPSRTRRLRVAPGFFMHQQGLSSIEPSSDLDVYPAVHYIVLAGHTWQPQHAPAPAPTSPSPLGRQKRLTVLRFSIQQYERRGVSLIKCCPTIPCSPISLLTEHTHNLPSRSPRAVLFPTPSPFPASPLTMPNAYKHYPRVTSTR